MNAIPPRRTDRWYLAWMVALAPLPLIAIGWGHDDLSRTLAFARSYALPIVAVETTIAIVAIVEVRRISSLPRLSAVLLLALVAIAFFSAANAPNPPPSLLMTLLWVNHLLFGLGIYQLARHRLLSQRDVICAMQIAFVLFGLALVAYYVLHSGHGHNWYNDSPPFNNIRWLGYFCAAIFGLCAWGWLEGRKGSLAIAIFALAFALWTGSRGSLVAVLGGYAAALLFVPAAARDTLRFLGAVLLALLLALAASFIWPLEQGSAERLFLGAADSGRIKVWWKTLIEIGERPWFGWGEAQFGTLFQSSFAQPHNIVLQILLAWGIVGLALVGVLVSRFAVEMRRIGNRQNAPLIFAVCNIMAFSSIDGALFHVHSVSIFALCVALILADRGTVKAEGTPSR